MKVIKPPTWWVQFAVIFHLTFLTSTSKAITCYNLTSLDGQFSSASTVSGCLACMRYTTMYDTASVKYTMFQWACSLQPSASAGMTAPGSAASAPQCIASTTVVTYADKSLYNKACTCCSNLCNDESFCQPTPHLPADSLAALDSETKCMNSNDHSSSSSISTCKLLITYSLLLVLIMPF